MSITKITCKLNTMVCIMRALAVHLTRITLISSPSHCGSSASYKAHRWRISRPFDSCRICFLCSFCLAFCSQKIDSRCLVSGVMPSSCHEKFLMQNLFFTIFLSTSWTEKLDLTILMGLATHANMDDLRHQTPPVSEIKY